MGQLYSTGPPPWWILMMVDFGFVCLWREFAQPHTCIRSPSCHSGTKNIMIDWQIRGESMPARTWSAKSLGWGSSTTFSICLRNDWHGDHGDSCIHDKSPLLCVNHPTALLLLHILPAELCQHQKRSVNNHYHRDVPEEQPQCQLGPHPKTIHNWCHFGMCPTSCEPRIQKQKLHEVIVVQHLVLEQEWFVTQQSSGLRGGNVLIALGLLASMYRVQG